MYSVTYFQELCQQTLLPVVSLYYTWLVLCKGKMNKIAPCDWVPEQVRWRYLSRSGLPCKKIDSVLFPYMITPLLIKLV